MSEIISIDFSLMHSLKTQLTSKYLNIDTRSDQILVKNVYCFCIIKLKVKIVLAHVFKAYMSSERVAKILLSLGTRLR